MGRVKPKTVKKAVIPSSPQKHHWKRPGFNAFGAQASSTTKKGSARLARCVEVEPPETGIHSFAWANAIVPQSAGLLKLPIEVRHKIWNLVFEDLSCGDESIKPMKKGKRFYSTNWPEAARETTALSETCRQMYVDVVGGGLLYKAKQFSFSPGLLLNYLWVINPVHKNSIRSIHLYIKVGQSSFSLPTKAFTMLAELPGLQDLHIQFNLDSSLCHAPRYHLTSHQPPITIQYWEKRRVPSSMLTKIRTCAALREINGLQSFKMDFVTYTQERSGLRDAIGYPIYEWKEVQLCTGSSGPYYDLAEELKEAVVAKK